MGCIGDELRLALKLTAQTLSEMIEGLYQRPQLALHRDPWQGPQIIRLALLHGGAQTLQWPQRRTDRKPHHQQSAQPQHAQAQQGVGHQAARHRYARLIGFSHPDLGHAVHVGFAHRFEQADHTHVLPQVLSVIKTRQRRVIVGA